MLFRSQSLVKSQHGPAQDETKEKAARESEAAKEIHGEEAEAAPSSELFRFSDLPLDTRIDGKSIFQHDEIRTAIEQLDGGADLADELDKADKAYVLAEPMRLHGDQFIVHACGRSGCNQQSVVFRYDLRSKHIGVCQTKPYMDGMAISYTYTKWGIEETGTCEGNPFPKGI